MKYETRGVSPNREFVVQFSNVPYRYHRDTLNTFQYVLYEGTNDIQVNYMDITSYGEDYYLDAMAAGIENADGTIGLQYPRMSTPGNYVNFYVRYSTNPGVIQTGPPTAATGEATSVTARSAALNGTVNPNGVATTSYCQYGTSADYGTITTTTNAGSGTSSTPVSIAISGLTQNTVYHYRLVATSSAGTNYGDDRTFTTSLSSSSGLLYFPYIASADNWETEICVINTSDTQTLNGVFKAYNPAGGHISEDIPVELDPHGRREIVVGDEFAKSDYIGYVVFESDTGAVAGYSKFYIEGRYRAAVPAVSEINTGDIYISHIAADLNWQTDITLLNTTSSNKDFTIEFDNGQTRTRSLYANERRTFTIKSLLGGEPQPDIHSAVIKNANGVIGQELFTSSVWNIMSGILLNGDTSTTIYYPHTASERGWGTGIHAYNPSDTDCDITITPYTAAGDPLTPAYDTIGGKEQYVRLVSDPALGLPADTAWLKIDAASPITGFELFANTNLLAGYTGVGITGTEGIFAKLEKNGATGIAFVNIENSAATVTLTAYDDSGAVIATETIDLNAHEKKGGFAEAIFTGDISNATYITYSSDRDVVGSQINASSDGMMLDGLPGM